MKRILTLLALAALFLTACDSLRTQTYQDNLEMPLAENSADSLFFDISLEYAVGGRGLSDEALDAMNAVIGMQALDLDEMEGSLEENAVQYRESLIEEYLAENGEGGLDPLTWEDRINGVFTGRCKHWENYLLSYYSYRGGAHGIQTVSQLVFSRKTGELLTEDALFKPGYEAPVARLLREAVEKGMLAEDAELLPLVEMESVVPNGNFSIGDAGVQWIFQPYEAGPYALGLVMGTVSWNKLKPYLRFYPFSKEEFMKDAMEARAMYQ